MNDELIKKAYSALGDVCEEVTVEDCNSDKCPLYYDGCIMQMLRIYMDENSIEY